MLVFYREIDSIALCVFGPDIAEGHRCETFGFIAKNLLCGSLETIVGDWK
jgi:hypothetical protein